MVKIALVNPDTFTKYPQPPLGLLNVAASCEAKGHIVWLVDANANNLTDERILQLVEVASIVGLTATSLSYPEARRLAGVLRDYFPTRFIVLGGIHASLLPRDVIKEGIFDAVVVGEGENMGPLVMANRLKGVNESTQTVNLNTMPVLNYGLLGKWLVAKSPYGKHKPFMPILTSRGCPFKCSFCSKVVLGVKYRVQNVERVMAEIGRLLELGVNEVKFYDDLFTFDKGRAEELSQRINRRVSWSCMTRVNLVDQKVLKYMASGGCHTISFGFESGSQEILTSVSKDTTLEQAEQAVQYSKEAGLKVIGYFMLGAPGETLQTIEQTAEFAIKLGIDHAQFSIATALPGSELAKAVPESQRASSYLMGGTVNPSLCELSPAQLQLALKQANERFKKGK